MESKRPRRAGWEYLVEPSPSKASTYNEASVYDAPDGAETTAMLNQRGDEGWELSGIVPPHEGVVYTTFVFKRRRLS